MGRHDRSPRPRAGSEARRPSTIRPMRADLRSRPIMTFSRPKPSLCATSGRVVGDGAHGDDFSFVHSSWRYGIESWRFHLPHRMAADRTRGAYRTRSAALPGRRNRPYETFHPRQDYRGVRDGPRRPSVRRRHDSAVGGEDHYDFRSAGTRLERPKPPGRSPRVRSWASTRSRCSQKHRALPAADDSRNENPIEFKPRTFRVEEFRVPLMKAAVRMPSATLVGATNSRRPERGIPLGRRGERIAGHSSQPD